MKACIRVLLAVLLFPGVIATAEGEGGLLGELLAARDLEARRMLCEQFVAAAPDPEEVAARLAQGRVYAADVEKGWLENMNPCADGFERPYLLFVPDDYDPLQRHRFVVDMYGGVSRPEILSHAELEQMKSFWGGHAQEQG